MHVDEEVKKNSLPELAPAEFWAQVTPHQREMCEHFARQYSSTHVVLLEETITSKKTTLRRLIVVGPKNTYHTPEECVNYGEFAFGVTPVNYLKL